MRVAPLMLLLLAAAALAAASPAPPPEPSPTAETPVPHRHRRFLTWGLGGVGDAWQDFQARVHAAWVASRLWLYNLLGLLPSSHAPVAVLPVGFVKIRYSSVAGSGDVGADLVWDGHHIRWRDEALHRLPGSTRVVAKVRVAFNGTSHAVPLPVLERHLNGVVPAGKRVALELLGSTAQDLRIVVHVRGDGKHGGDKDAAKSGVSILVSQLLEEAKRFKQEHRHKKHHHGGHKGDDQDHDHQVEGKDGKSSKSGKSRGMLWDGKKLTWADGVGQDKGEGDAAGKPARRHRARLRVKQNGVSNVIPLRIIARHLKGVAAGSEVSLEVRGSTMKDLRVVLHVREHRSGKKDKEQAISVPVALLIKEAGSKAGATPAPAAHFEVEGKSKSKKKADKAEKGGGSKDAKAKDEKASTGTATTATQTPGGNVKQQPSATQV